MSDFDKLMQDPQFRSDFALVSWRPEVRMSSWSFWRRGTGEKGLYHHCRPQEDDWTCPVDYLWPEAKKEPVCRDCKIKPPDDVLAAYREWSKPR